MSRSGRRILVILDDVGPGDALRSKFAVTTIRGAHPEAQITLLVSAAAAEVFASQTACDRVIVSRIYRAGIHSGWRNRLHKTRAMLAALRAVGRRHDLVLILNWGTSTLAVLARLASHRVIGYENRAAFLLSCRLGSYDVEGDPVAQNRALLAAAGIGEPATSRSSLLEDHEALHDSAPRYAVLHTGSDWACQQWSQDRWAGLADRLVDEHGLQVIFTGVAEEMPYIAEVQRMMRRPSTSLAGRTTLAALQSLIARAALFVTVDSAPYELAQLTRTATVVLAGPTSPRSQIRSDFVPVVVNRTSPELGLTIRTCQRAHADGHCHDYACPLSRLRRIEVDDVVRQIELSAAAV